MLSFWETQSFTDYEYVIVGSGIVGLSTAASVLERNDSAKVLILERGLFPSGASTKNAGFACFGSLTEILSDLNIMSETRVLQLVELRYKGLQKLRSRLKDKNIGFEQHGGYELLFKKNHLSLEKIDYLNQLVKPILQKDSVILNDELIARFGFPQNVKHIVSHPLEGQIDTGKMMNNLIHYVQRLGAKIITGCEVENIEIAKGKLEISVKNHCLNQSITFKANKVVVCTNAFTKKFFPEADITPGRGQVLITKPIDDLKFKGVFHFDEGYYYFRNVGNRVLFGGGRNLDFAGETTLELNTTNLIIGDLKKKLKEIILPETDFEIEQTWAGIMAFGEDKFPILKKVNNQIIIAARMGGMGIAIGAEWGEQAAALLLQD
jgi:glycine/D-amino acid oxidase-like deaminating enzyme